MNTKFGYCPELVRLLASRETRGRSGRVFTRLAALSTVNNLSILRQLMMVERPKRTLEIGLSFGGSALVFAASHRDLEHAPAAQHTALDPFQSSVWDDAGLFAIESAGLLGYLDYRPEFSSLELPRLVCKKALFDLVYVDGSHLFEDVFLDFYWVARLLGDGGMVAFDDCADPNVAKVLRFITRNFGTGFREVDLGPYRSDGGRPLRYRLARLLGKNQLRAFQKIGPVERPWNAAFADF